MSKTRFDDQHQPMSNWLDKLANDEAQNFSDAELVDESVSEPKGKKFAGIATTWNKKRSVDRPMASDSSRQVSSRPQATASVEQIEKTAKGLLMSGINLEKMSAILSRRYSEDEMTKFATIMPKLEAEYGKLGCIYLDASLVDSCNDLAEIQKTSHKVASIAVRDVIHTAKCDDCNYNKRGNCVKLGLNIVDTPEIKSVAEAKSIINKFASLRYINSYFVKSEDLTSYYKRLATNENPAKVVQDFLLDINSRRVAKQTTNARMDVSESTSAKIANREHIVKVGKTDNEVGNAFKQFLVRNPSIKAAKAELLKRYSSDRIESYIKEAKKDLHRFAKFIETKAQEHKSRVSSAIESPTTANLSSRMSEAKVASAIKMAYSLMTFSQPLDTVRKTLTRNFNAEVASEVISKIAADKEAQFIGITYIDSNLYSSPNEMKQVHDLLKRRSNNMIYMVKESSICNMTADGICPTTGLKIVKSAVVDSRRQALRVLNQAKTAGVLTQFDLDRASAKLADLDNAHTVRSFITSQMTKKAISEGLVKQVTDIALKYAKDVQVVRKIASTKWSSVKTLIETLDSHVINKNAFRDDLKPVLNKTASDANAFLKPTNQYNVKVFSADKNKVSDVTLGQTM
jgi:hypothetical protein